MRKIILFLYVFAALSVMGQTAYRTVNDWSFWCTPPYDHSSWSASGNLVCSGTSVKAYPGMGWQFHLFSDLLPVPNREYEVDNVIGISRPYPQEFVQYLRATVDSNLRANVGTFYAIALSKPTAASSFTLTIYKRAGSTLTTLLMADTGLTSVSRARSLVRSSGTYPGISTRLFNGTTWKYWHATDTTIASGKPGFAMFDDPNAPTYQGGVDTTVFYAADQVAPNAISSGTIAISRFSDRVEMQWAPTTDNSGGSGIRAYEVW